MRASAVPTAHQAARHLPFQRRCQHPGAMPASTAPSKQQADAYKRIIRMLARAFYIRNVPEKDPNAPEPRTDTQKRKAKEVRGNRDAHARCTTALQTKHLWGETWRFAADAEATQHRLQAWLTTCCKRPLHTAGLLLDVSTVPSIPTEAPHSAPEPTRHDRQAEMEGLAVVVIDALTRREWVQEDYVPQAIDGAPDLRVCHLLGLGMTSPRGHGQGRGQGKHQWCPSQASRMLRAFVVRQVTFRSPAVAKACNLTSVKRCVLCRLQGLGLAQQLQVHPKALRSALRYLEQEQVVWREHRAFKRRRQGAADEEEAAGARPPRCMFVPPAFPASSGPT